MMEAKKMEPSDISYTDEYIRTATRLGNCHNFLTDMLEFGEVLLKDKDLARISEISIDEVKAAREILIKYMTFFAFSLHKVSEIVYKTYTGAANESK